LHPLWFYEAASVAARARLSRWAGAGIADMEKVVRQGKSLGVVVLEARGG